MALIAALINNGNHWVVLGYDEGIDGEGLYIVDTEHYPPRELRQGARVPLPRPAGKGPQAADVISAFL